MATITVRIDEDTRVALQRHAAGNGLTVSDFVRDLIREQVVDRDEEIRRVGYAPDSLAPQERHALALLHRILARVLPDETTGPDGDREYQLERARVLEEGFTHEYWVEFAGIEAELSARDSQRVHDILELFRVADDSIAELERIGTPVSAEVREALRYRGFDFNDSLEMKMASYVRYLVKADQWTERAEFVLGRGSGNSHMPLLESYLRMLAEYRRVRARRSPGLGRSGYLLTADELQALADAQVHPENRR